MGTDCDVRVERRRRSSSLYLRTAAKPIAYAPSEPRTKMHRTKTGMASDPPGNAASIQTVPTIEPMIPSAHADPTSSSSVNSVMYFFGPIGISQSAELTAKSSNPASQRFGCERNLFTNRGGKEARGMMACPPVRDEFFERDGDPVLPPFRSFRVCLGSCIATNFAIGGCVGPRSLPLLETTCATCPDSPLG